MNIIDKLRAIRPELEPLIHGSLKGKLPELTLAIDGFISPEQAGKINSSNNITKISNLAKQSWNR